MEADTLPVLAHDELAVTEKSSGVSSAPETDSDDSAPATTLTEIRAWMSVDFANSTYASVGIAGFLPLLAQSAALASAGFPQVCGNIVRNATFVASVFPPVHGAAAETSMYFLSGFPGRECEDPTRPHCVGDYCRGVPESTSDCRLADGITLQQLRTGAGTGVDPTTYATLSIAASVLVQARRRVQRACPQLFLTLDAVHFCRPSYSSSSEHLLTMGGCAKTSLLAPQ